ncbi:MAG: T9SS type A sorting domain-containing protein [Bacteroidales bacterium]|nr:T9SS type A sorting domain-containing protein [Bacteroidales bacterium]
MKHLITLILLFFFTNIFAQITITQTDLPTVNDTIYYKMGIINNFDSNVTGANVVWDFSQVSFNNQRADTIISVTSTPIVYNVIFNFTIANLAFINQTPPSLGVGITVSDYYDFYKKTSSYYRKAGFGATINGVQTPVKYDYPELYFKLPLTYGTTDSSVSSYGLSIPNYGYYGQTINRKHIADGWGTLITPFGTYNAIRVKETVNITDTIFSESMNFGYTINRPVSYEYYWLANGMKGHVVKITKNGPSNIIEVRYDPLLFVNNLSNTDIYVFPNPAANQLFINQLPEGVKHIALTNILGQVCFNSQSIEKNIMLNISTLPNGIYFIEIKTSKGCFKKTIVVDNKQ